MRERRQRERGQVIIISALMAVLIFGAAAIAVDLGLQTNDQRQLQNVSDSAALAGAEDIPGSGGCPGSPSTAQNAAIVEALGSVGLNMNWGSSWDPSPSVSCAANSAVATASDGAYTVTVSTPPATPRSANYGASGPTGVDGNPQPADYLEVDLHESVSNSFAAVLGLPTSEIGAHSVAFHWGPSGPYDYTFFSQQQTCSGNQTESITGDAYIGPQYQPQCHSGNAAKASLCVYESGGSYGHVTFSQVPPANGTDPQYGISAACGPGRGAITAQAPGPTPTDNNCPGGAHVGQDPSSGTYVCYDASPPSPASLSRTARGLLSRIRAPSMNPLDGQLGIPPHAKGRSAPAPSTPPGRKGSTWSAQAAR